MQKYSNRYKKLLNRFIENHQCVRDLFEYAETDIMHMTLLEDVGPLVYLYIWNTTMIERGDENWTSLDFVKFRSLLD